MRARGLQQAAATRSGEAGQAAANENVVAASRLGASRPRQRASPPRAAGAHWFMSDVLPTLRQAKRVRPQTTRRQATLGTASRLSSCDHARARHAPAVTQDNHFEESSFAAAARHCAALWRRSATAAFLAQKFHSLASARRLGRERCAEHACVPRSALRTSSGLGRGVGCKICRYSARAQRVSCASGATLRACAGFRPSWEPAPSRRHGEQSVSCSLRLRQGSVLAPVLLFERRRVKQQLHHSIS